MRTTLRSVLLLLVSTGALAQDEATIARHLAHESHHAWAKRRGPITRDGSKGTGPSVLSSLVAGQTVTIADYACRASAIIVASLGEATAVASADGALIFSDYALTVESVVKGRAPSMITRVGGEIGGDTPRRFRSQLLPMLVQGERYLLFLGSVAGSDALAADFPGGTLRLLPTGEAEEVDGVRFVKGLPKSGQTMSTSTLLADVGIAVSTCPR